MFRQWLSPVPRSSTVLVMDHRMGTVYARHVVRFIFIVALLGAWFMPLIIAALYKLPHQRPIAVLSLLLGWTGAGWLAAFVIAVGGAIRAAGPAAAGHGQPQDQRAVAAQPNAPAQSAWPAAAPTSPLPAGAQPSGRAQSPERSQPQERRQPSAPPSWPDNPH
jgi:hypothetical protein